ncbi:MAG TPA: AI-2E family transporter [Bryobacteraceae bacterium]|jgi:predicted PurR-regulated permease PerM|nr:AI-2E family transporter [Bryobacteraceae bacterium]
METPTNSDFLLTISRGFLWRLCAIALISLLIWYAGRVLVATFAGILVAVILRALTRLVQRATKLNARWSFTIVLLLIGGVAALSVILLAPRIITQGAEIAHVIPQSIARVRDELNQYDWGRFIDGTLSNASANLNIASKVGSWATALVSAISTAVIVLAIGVFAAVDPEFYERWILRYFPDERRKKAAALFKDLEDTLRWWLLGQLVPMTVLGIGVFIGLWLLKIPLALTLALFTAFMLFIPYVGSVISLIPAALVALMEGPGKMISVIVLYLSVHSLEGYVLTPLVQRRAVHLPPVVTILAQFLMWTIAGPLGLIIATPIAAAGLTMLNFFYYYGEKGPPSDELGLRR